MRQLVRWQRKGLVGWSSDAQSGIINGVATLTSIATGALVWPQAIVMTVGAILGGYWCAHFEQKLPQLLVRSFVILTSAATTTYFFIREYR